MKLERLDQAQVIINAAQAQLKLLGFKCLQSPTSLPQGLSLSLLVGTTDLAVVGAHVALAEGSASAHSTEGSSKFRHEVADFLLECAIIEAENQTYKGNPACQP